MNQQSEYQLRNRRDELERRLLTLEETIKRADHLVGQISVVLNYLTSDLKQVGEIVEDAIQKSILAFGLLKLRKRNGNVCQERFMTAQLKCLQML